MDCIFIIIGVGGIGGCLARDLPKLMINRSSDAMLLIDGDTIQEKNCVRQPYQKQDIGINKSRALAKKINSFYSIDCYFHDKYLSCSKELEDLCEKYDKYIPVFIGCVDNDATRKLIEEAYLKQRAAAYIDGANSEYEGNVYVSYISDYIKNGPIRSNVYKLEDDTNPAEASCEEKVAKGNVQFLVTNNKVSAIMLEHIHSLFKGIKYLRTGVTIVEGLNAFHK